MFRFGAIPEIKSFMISLANQKAAGQLQIKTNFKLTLDTKSLLTLSQGSKLKNKAFALKVAFETRAKILSTSETDLRQITDNKRKA